MAVEAAQTAGSLTQALDRAVELLGRSPSLAERQAREILALVPGEPRARLILGMALRRRGQNGAARETLEALAADQPRSARTHVELGDCLASLGDYAGACVALRTAVSLDANSAAAWRALAEALTALGHGEEADRAFAEMIRASVTDPRLMQAAGALCEDRLAVAEHLLREHLRAHPSDVAAMRMLAEAGTRMGRYAEVESLLDRCLELAPGFEAARFNQAHVLFRQQKGAAAIGHLQQLLASEPRSPRYRNLMASSLALVGEYGRARELFETLVAEHPGNAQAWLNLGHTLRTLGARDEAESAYKRAIGLNGAMGDAWWSLANLKTRPFSGEERAAMAAELTRADLPQEDRLHLHYAMGKALEDGEDFAASFEHYVQGARLRREMTPFDADAARAEMRRHKALFTKMFFAERADRGAVSAVPIFIVGLPRSGSTLIEQILASHSQVEGTMELPDIPGMARELGWNGRRGEGPAYPEILASLGAQDFAALGEAFLERTRVHRKLGRRLFIDKMPGNFHHLGLIRLVLPGARIIDARRHPMAAGFSAFKQHFARGHAFSYDLADIGSYYCDYVELMAHFDEVQPGAVVRVIHEDLVDDPEGQIRRLLEGLGLDFEPACLRFHETARPVRTASSEQVRRPIFRDGLDQWRRYEAWLGPLAAAAAPVMDSWRGEARP
jgi:predicted Zn-dependent protease